MIREGLLILPDDLSSVVGDIILFLCSLRCDCSCVMPTFTFSFLFSCFYVYIVYGTILITIIIV